MRMKFSTMMISYPLSMLAPVYSYRVHPYSCYIGRGKVLPKV
jgi:hypothetical protein